MLYIFDENLCHFMATFIDEWRRKFPSCMVVKRLISYNNLFLTLREVTSYRCWSPVATCLCIVLSITCIFYTLVLIESLINTFQRRHTHISYWMLNDWLNGALRMQRSCSANFLLFFYTNYSIPAYNDSTQPVSMCEVTATCPTDSCQSFCKEQ